MTENTNIQEAAQALELDEIDANNADGVKLGFAAIDGPHEGASLALTDDDEIVAARSNGETAIFANEADRDALIKFLCG